MHTLLYKEMYVELTDKHLREIRNFLISFESRQTHPLAINSPLMGVHKLVMVDRDFEAVFNIFGIDKTEFRNLLSRVNLINPKFKVSSNPFNNLIIWTLHLTHVSKKLSKKGKADLSFCLAKILIYKFYTSLVNQRFQHPANEEVMQATINSLSNKFDIIRYGTWGSVIDSRALDLLEGIHKKTIEKYDNDKKILYALTDPQSRVRDKIKKIYREYMLIKEAGDIVKAYGSTYDLDGEKVIANQVSTFDSMLNNMMVEMTNMNSFIEDRHIRLTAGMFKTNLRPDTFRAIMMKFCELSILQSKSGELDSVKKIKNDEIYVGCRILLLNLIQKSYRFCIKSGTDLNKGVLIINSLKNLYSSSRIKDPELMKIKESVRYFIDEYSGVKREATKSSLRIAFVLYIILKTFKYM